MAHSRSAAVFAFFSNQGGRAPRPDRGAGETPAGCEGGGGAGRRCLPQPCVLARLKARFSRRRVSTWELAACPRPTPTIVQRQSLLALHQPSYTLLLFYDPFFVMSEIRRKLVIVGDGACGKVRCAKRAGGGG